METKRIAIPENWKYINQLEADFRTQFQTNEASFTLNYFVLEDNSFMPIHIRYRKKRKNGEYYDKIHYSAIPASYCPFTGQPLYKDVVKESSKNTLTTEITTDGWVTTLNMNGDVYVEIGHKNANAEYTCRVTKNNVKLDAHSLYKALLEDGCDGDLLNVIEKICPDDITKELNFAGITND